MKKLFALTLLFSSAVAASFAGSPVKLPMQLTFSKLMDRPAYRNAMIQAQETMNASAHNKVPKKRPQFIVTRAWDDTKSAWGDTTDKIILNWHNNTLLSITDYTYDATNGNGKSIESGFEVITDEMPVDSNISFNLFPTSIVNQIWQGGKWVNESQEIATVDSKGHFTSLVEQTWNGSAFTDMYKLELSYDNNDNFVEFAASQSVGGKWVVAEDLKEVLTLDKDNNITELVQQIGIGGGSYVPMIKESFTLDAKGQIASAMFYTYDSAMNQWTKSDSFANVTWQTYDPHMRLNLQTGGTVGVFAVGGDKYKSYTQTPYDALSQSWSIGTRHTITYDANGNCTSRLTQSQNNNTWQNQTRDTTTYYSRGDVKAYTNQYWAGGWQLSSAYTDNNTYDADNDITESIVMVPDPSNSSKMINQSQSEYTYLDNTGIATVPAEDRTVNIYPNPTADRLFVNLPSGEKLVSVSVSDLAGKTIAEQVNESRSFDVSSLRSGMYIATVKTENSSSSYKFIRK